MFLWDGRYPSLLMRLLGLRLVPASPHLTRLVSYEFMNRQLVWGAFTEFLMLSIPLLPPVPRFLTPSTLLAPLKLFLSQPTSIDYNSIPLLPAADNSEKPSSLAHSGPLAHLPLSTCPICHLRTSSAPVPLASTSSGSAITLPPLHGGGIASEFENEQSDEETRVFVPAETDCWGGCRWCYYCIAGELAKHRQEAEEEIKKAGKGEKAASEAERKWECLRCGGGVTRAWRVGTERLDQSNHEPVAGTEHQLDT